MRLFIVISVIMGAALLLFGVLGALEAPDGEGGGALFWLFLWPVISGMTWVGCKFTWVIIEALFIDHYDAQQRHAARQHRDAQLHDAWMDESEQELRARRFAQRAETSRRSGTGFTRRTHLPASAARSLRAARPLTK